jgi:hypothetical protein
MAKARVLLKSFLNNRLVEPGEIIDYDGPYGDNVEPVKGKKGAPPEPEPEPAVEPEQPPAE